MNRIITGLLGGLLGLLVIGPSVAFAVIQQNDLFCSPETQTVLVGESVTFTASSTTIRESDASAKKLVWAARGADIDTGIGYTFTTSYSQPGTYGVIVGYMGNGRVTASCEVVVQ